LDSVVVIHDGSLQGHRAVQMALQFASRSFARLDLIGIFGIRIGTSEASSSPDDYEWQKGWLSSLVQRYAQQAIADGVSVNSTLFAANDPCAVLDTINRMRFDLIVIPNRLTRFGNHGERLVPTVISRRNANVLVCP
jgi:hypothetical protein